MIDTLSDLKQGAEQIQESSNSLIFIVVLLFVVCCMLMYGVYSVLRILISIEEENKRNTDES